MDNFNIQRCEIEGLYIIDPKVYGDERGYNMETYHYEAFKNAGLDMVFVQDNQSLSKKGVIRGLHYQKTYPQGKLVRALAGMVYDVAVDLRKNSKTYGKWHGVTLSDQNHRMFYIPEGFAHGFLVLSEEAVFTYKCTNFYHPEDEGGIAWNDPELTIDWPIGPDMEISLSDKDKKHPLFKDNRITF